MKRTHAVGSVFDADCPAQVALTRIADKWTVIIIHALADGAKRHSELRRQIGGVSQKVLTQTLRRLQRDGFVSRHDHGVVPPRVDYSLTPLGRSLTKPLAALCRWAEDHRTALEISGSRTAKAKQAALGST